ncbi:MAG: cell division protein FtsL [Moraxellaceae bacterium]|jgi:cell division protein FtsL|nr:cell division protein FtsL [Moraxellaceae bacterium]
MSAVALKAAVEARVRESLLRLLGPLTAAAVVLTLVTTAVAVAYSAHKSRSYLNELTRLEAERDRLETEWGQLLLEQHTWGAYGRIGKLATEQLQMRNPAPTEIIMVRQ